jgi:hypothetical protein
MEERRKAHLVKHLSSVTKAVVLGALMTALVQGALVGIGFALETQLPAPDRRWPQSSVREDAENSAASPRGFPEP